MKLMLPNTTTMDQMIQSKHGYVLFIRNVILTLSCLGYLSIIYFLILFPVTWFVLLFLGIVGCIFLAFVQQMYRSWGSCYLRSEMLIIKKLNRKAMVVPDYCVKRLRTRSFIFFSMTRVDFLLDGRYQTARIIHEKKA